MRKSVRNLALCAAVLFATTVPVFASTSGSDPRPPQTTTTATSAIIVQAVLSTLGL